MRQAHHLTFYLKYGEILKKITNACILFYMIAVQQLKDYRNLFTATLNDLREGAKLFWQVVPKESTSITERTF